MAKKTKTPSKKFYVRSYPFGMPAQWRMDGPYDTREEAEAKEATYSIAAQGGPGLGATAYRTLIMERDE